MFDDCDYEQTKLETGYRKPLASLVLSDKLSIQRTLKMHVLLRLKPELDQLIEGLKVCGILDSICRYPLLMAQYITHTVVDTRWWIDQILFYCVKPTRVLSP